MASGLHPHDLVERIHGLVANTGDEFEGDLGARRGDGGVVDVGKVACDGLDRELVTGALQLLQVVDGAREGVAERRSPGAGDPGGGGQRAGGAGGVDSADGADGGDGHQLRPISSAAWYDSLARSTTAALAW
ncbi:hypothetical protein GCM10027406_28380 [Leifsonia lichenia]